jgi:hypothetical protein
MMQKKKRAGAGHGSAGAPALQGPAAGSRRQLRATTAVKDARKKEAGLQGKRTGKASASGKRAQGRRDAKR